MRPTARSSSARARRRSTAPTAIPPSSTRCDMAQGQSLGHVSRWRALTLSPASLFPFVVAELVTLWLIVVTGAAVRLTDSGLGCRHWPGCEAGHPLPAKSGHAFIEFGNRLFGALTIAATLLAWLAARRTPALSRRHVQLALAIFLGTLLQAPIGLLAVASDLRWPIVMVHLLLSIALLGAATVLLLEVRAVQVGRVEPLVYAHGAVVGVFLITFLFSLGYLAARRERSHRLFLLGAAVFAVLLAQMGLGELQWRTHLPWGLVLLHVFLAATVWVGTIALATLFWRPNVDLADR